jgi:hypothetical protein
MADKDPVKMFVDGIQSIASHNGVHRVVFFNLVGDGKQNAPVLELMVPVNAARSIGEAFMKLGGDVSTAPGRVGTSR